MRIIFAGGGTVGHITPSIAVADALLKKYPKSKILFVGREGGEENEVIKREGYELKTIRISGLERKLSFENIKNVLTAMKAVREAKKILKEFRPDAVFGTGGYVCYPIVKAAQKLGIKNMLHESNACLGLASKALASECNVILKGIDGNEHLIPEKVKTVSTGNPVRKEFLDTDREKARRKLGISKNEILIVSFGGSGGSEKLNDTLIDLMEDYSMKNANISHIHGSGKKYYKDIAKHHPLLVNGRNGCVVKPYLTDMAELLSAADIAITRCGAMTLAELSVSKTPSILIPSPNVTNDHQKKNALRYEKSGAAIMIEENDLTPEKLTEMVKALVKNSKLRKEMSRRMETLSSKDAISKIIHEIELITSEVLP